MKKYAVFPLMLILLGGCATTSPSSGNATQLKVQEKGIKVFDDIPIYPGFREIPEKSFLYESGNIKVGRLVFVGNASVKSVVDYYKDSLPQTGWEPISVTIYGKAASMTYTTLDRVLQIEVKEEFSGTKLIIQVGPKGELTTESK